VSALQALAYLDLLNGVAAADRITFARGAAPGPPGGPEPDGLDPEEPEWYRPPSDGDNPGADSDPGDDGPDDHGGPGGFPGNRDGGSPAGSGTAPAPPLVELAVPLATLQQRAKRAGDNRLLGPLDPAMARDLAAAAARSPFSRWAVTIVDDRGYATSHGLARPERGSRPQPPPDPGSTAVPARVNITITETLLRQLADQPRPGAPPGDWALTTSRGTWTLTLPGGRQLAVRLDTVPTHDCDHTHQTSSYQPGDRLRRLIQVRDHECTFPTCSRPAHESDFEHAVPYDKGGKTCGCNAGARSRRCHQVKQSPGWTVTQPKPGWHTWTTPTGRTYTQEPWRYIA
jgi:hypothetical protein